MFTAGENVDYIKILEKRHYVEEKNRHISD